MCGCAMSGGWAWMMGPVGLVAMLGAWALLIGGAVVLYRAWAGGRLGASRADAVLARRFAAGDIGADEYRERLATLREARDEARWTVLS